MVPPFGSAQNPPYVRSPRPSTVADAADSAISANRAWTGQGSRPFSATVNDWSCRNAGQVGQVDDQGDLQVGCGIGHGLVGGLRPLGARGTARGPKGGCSGMAAPRPSSWDSGLRVPPSAHIDHSVKRPRCPLMVEGADRAISANQPLTGQVLRPISATDQRRVRSFVG